jgi:predicted nicotinamide N-methyase
LRVTDDVVALWERTEDRPGAAAGEPPFWAVAWAGGQALARYLLDHPGIARGRRVLDLGCGGGLVAVAAALAGGRVTAVDTDPLALAATRVNARTNAVDVSCLCADLLAPQPGPPTGPAHSWPAPLIGAVEVVLAGDVFYAKAMADRLEPFLRSAARAGCTVLIGDPHRAYLPRTGLELLAETEIGVPAELEGTATRWTSVFRLLP